MLDGILGFFSTLGEFVWALVTNWIVYMTAFPLILDDLIKWCSPKAAIWLEKKLSGERRRKAEIYLMFIGFFIASFMAYDGEHESYKAAVSAKDDALKQLAAMSPNGQLEEIKSLQSKMEKAQIAFAEVEAKQQEEMDRLKSSTSELGPRMISDEQSNKFIASLAQTTKGPVAVFELSGSSAEVTNFANQLRTLLDSAGYSDPDKPKVVENPFASIGGSGKVSGSCLAIKSKDPKDLPDYVSDIQNAFKSLGIPSDAIVDDKNVLGMKDKEIGVVVQAR